MDLSLLWRAAGIQLLAVASLFALLLASPLPGGFFRDYGVLAGPASWLACSLLTGRLLSLGLANTLLVALVSGAAAALIGTVAGHAATLVAAVILFGVVAALRGRGGVGRRPSPLAAR